MTDVFIDPRFEPRYRAHPLVLADVGARGGLRKNWLPAKRHLRLIGFEPDLHEFARLEECYRHDPAVTFLNVALHRDAGSLRLNVAKDGGLSSIFAPNRAFLDAFPDADRFDLVDERRVEVNSLDNLAAVGAITGLDFVKADTQGSELFVLQGAERALASLAVGVEVEVEFASVYANQPLFADVDIFLRGLGYELFDLRPCYWKRAAGRQLGGPHGQIIWADALYLRSIPALLGAVRALPEDERVPKILKAITVSLLYGYVDYGLATTIAAVESQDLAAEDAAVVERRLRNARQPRSLPPFPGRKRLALGLRRLWHLLRDRSEGWSISDPEIGNLD